MQWTISLGHTFLEDSSEIQGFLSKVAINRDTVQHIDIYNDINFTDVFAFLVTMI